MKKRIIALVVAVCLVCGATLLVACTPKKPESAQPVSEKLQIVTTIFPVYDWVKNIVGEDEKVEIIRLQDSGADLHNFQPTAEDMIKIANCDLFVYIGGESDEWVESALENAANPNRRVVNLMEALGERAKAEEVVEGMQEDAHHDDEDEEHHDDEEAPEYDEHIWLSLKNAQVLIEALKETLVELDTSRQMQYLDNAETYMADLAALDAAYQGVVDAANDKVLIFGDRFPFRYLTDDYGLTYFAAFVGCSAETEASFETISFLAAKADEYKVKNIMVLEKSDNKIAETIIKNTKEKNQQILALNSMQTVTNEEMEAGVDYLKIMQDNLAVLEKALA